MSSKRTSLIYTLLQYCHKEYDVVGANVENHIKSSRYRKRKMAELRRNRGFDDLRAGQMLTLGQRLLSSSKISEIAGGVPGPCILRVA
jgi:hypothetical protein